MRISILIFSMQKIQSSKIILKMIEQGDEERLVAETLKVNPILFEANSMQSLLMVFNQVV